MPESGEDRLKTDSLTKIAETTGYDLTMVTRWFSPNVKTEVRRNPTVTTCEIIGQAYRIQAWQVLKIMQERRLG